MSSQDEPGNVFANLVKPLSSDKFEAGLRLASDPGTLVEVLAFCGKKLHGATWHAMEVDITLVSAIFLLLGCLYAKSVSYPIKSPRLHICPFIV